MSSEFRKLICLQCGNENKHEVLGRCSFDEKDPHGSYGYSYGYDFVQCGTCDRPAIHAWHDLSDDPQVAVWPVKAFLDDSIPELVQKRYQDALLVKSRLPSAFAVQIRRALEVICSDQGCSGGDLAKKLDGLVSKHNLPETMKTVATVVRVLGNKGAHEGPEVTLKEASMVEDFFIALVEYVYIAPAKLERFARSLQAFNRPSLDPDPFD